MSKKVLVIQHSSGVRPAYVTEFFSQHQIPFQILRIYDPESEPDFPDCQTTDYLAIVSLGGPQAPYEDNEYPYLKWEKSFLAAQLALGTPILGLCLGAQLLADVIGGHGHLGKYGYEVGYVQYTLTEEGNQDPILSKLFQEQENQPLLIMHHKDSFDLPPSASLLAYTSNNYIAAFRFASAYAVQFHPEVSFTEFNEWVQEKLNNQPAAYNHLNIDEILRQARENEPKAKESRRLFFETWWNSVVKA